MCYRDEQQLVCVRVCVCVRMAPRHLGVVIVGVWQGGECSRRGKLGGYHLSPYGHSSLRSLHHGFQFVRRNVLGVDQQHHLSITQETRPQLQKTQPFKTLKSRNKKHKQTD